jgi:hypothetical protein
MGRNDGQLRQLFVKIIQASDHLTSERRVVVTVLQNQRFANALFKSACIIDGVAHVKQAPVGLEIHEDAHAAGRMSAQRHNDH